MIPPPPVFPSFWLRLSPIWKIVGSAPFPSLHASVLGWVISTRVGGVLCWIDILCFRKGVARYLWFEFFSSGLILPLFWLPFPRRLRDPSPQDGLRLSYGQEGPLSFPKHMKAGSRNTSSLRHQFRKRPGKALTASFARAFLGFSHPHQCSFSPKGPPLTRPISFLPLRQFSLLRHSSLKPHFVPPNTDAE